jgi:hypothetical protein
MRKERKPKSFKEALEKTQATFLVVLSEDTWPTLEWCEEWRTAPRATLRGFEWTPPPDKVAGILKQATAAYPGLLESIHEPDIAWYRNQPLGLLVGLPMGPEATP